MSIIKEPWRPKDGPGPRGVPDCYYRSRVLSSTGRYVEFVAALRRDEQRIAFGDAAAAQLRSDCEISEFTARTDRKSCISKVARKVDLCTQSYEDDLSEKRSRLKEQLELEEALHVRMMVEQAQAGAAAVAAQRELTLRALLEKRHRQAMATPTGEYVYSREEIRKQRTIEEKQIQQYQIREKQAIKMQQVEVDKMWKEVSVKEDEALAMRMELDVQDRYRRDMECNRYSDLMVQRKKELIQEQEQKSKEESLRMLQKLKEQEANALQGEAMAEAARRAAAKTQASEMARVRQESVLKRQQQERRVGQAYDSLVDQAAPCLLQHIHCRNRQKKEMVECNRRLQEVSRLAEAAQASSDAETDKMGAEMRRVAEERRCVFERKRITINKEAHEGRMKQISERQLKCQEEQDRQEEKAYLEMHFDHFCRMDQLQMESDAEKRKAHQKFLLQQIKEKELQREREDRADKETLSRCPGIPWGLERTDGTDLDRHAFSLRMKAGNAASAIADISPQPCLCQP